MTFSESTEVDFSALIDGELEQDQTLLLIDQLVENEECRGFYRSLRRLEGAVAAVPGVHRVSEPLPERIWHSIRQRSGLVSFRGRRSWRLPTLSPTWALGAAAIFLVVLALWDTLPAPNLGQSGRIRPGVRIELDVGKDPDRMSEERFVTLMAELLRADSRYHRKMLEVMSDVNRLEFEAEGSTEGRQIPHEGLRNESSHREARVASP